MTFPNFELDEGEDCSYNNAGSYFSVFDGPTVSSPLLANLACTNSEPVAGSTGTLLLYFHANAEQQDSFAASWLPTSAVCGNGVCERSADEYDLKCAATIFVDSENNNTMIHLHG